MGSFLFLIQIQLKIWKSFFQIKLIVLNQNILSNQVNFEITDNNLNIADDLGKSLLEIALTNHQQQIVLDILNNKKIDLKNIDFLKIFTNRISYSDHNW